ncbi:helix-turn-helix domain-containing protein [Paenibacillus sp. GCM10023252]|uniref:AraC family transcriptional regulator n=1 Tax=Paenibacillus sp. GCM10023252 TaxID=3252649 RepID=UPI003605CD91
MINQVLLRYDSIPLVKDIGYGNPAELWTHPDRILDFHVFLYIISGEFQVIEEGIEYILHGGEAFFLRKGLHHWGLPKTLPGTSWYWIHFYDKSDADYYGLDETTAFMVGPSAGHINAEQYQVKLALPKRMKPAVSHLLQVRLKELKELYELPGSCRPMILSLKTAELLLDLYQEAAANATSKADVTIGKIIQYLEACDPAGKFDSKQLADRLNMNYAYLSTLFTKKVGMSIQAYHTRLRIHQAMELLRHSSSNISEVSDRLGFSSPYHFSHVFKKTNGISPTQYLKQIYRS